LKVKNTFNSKKNVYKEGKLEPDTTYKKYLSVQREGPRDMQRERDFYNLDMSIVEVTVGGKK
jgi:hypothetical protein